MLVRNPDVFLSRSWNDHKEADEIVNKLKEYDIELKEDVRDAPYKNDLPALAGMISNVDCVIVLLSSRYLESLKCMKEMLQLLKKESVAEKMIFVALPDAKSLNEKSGRHYVEYWRREKEKLEKDKKKTSSDNVRKSITRVSRTVDAVLPSVESFFAGINKSNSLKFDRLKKSCEPLIRMLAWGSPKLAKKAERKLNVEEIVRNEQKKLRIIARNKIRSLRKRSLDVTMTDKTAILDIPLKALSAKEGANQGHEKIPVCLEKIANMRKPLMIFGGSGQGKTVLSTAIAEKVLDFKKRIPYFVRVEDIAVRSKASNIYDIILSRDGIDDLHPETLKKTRFCFIIDDCQILSAEVERKMSEAAERLNKEGHHVALLSDFSGRFPAPLKAPASGYETIIIDSEKIAGNKMTDEFIETRFSDPKEIKRLKSIVRKYDAGIRGFRQNLFLLTSILLVSNKYPKTIKKRVGDSGTLKKILNGGILSKFELYDAFTDYIVGKEEIKSKRNVKSRKDKKEKFAVKAFRDVFDPENSAVKGLKSPSMLYKNGKKAEFVHDSLREFFLTSYFAERINSGKLSVGKAHDGYWTYVEDSELWNLPNDKEWRALLPDWETTLAMIAERLFPEKRKKLIAVIEKNYNAVAKLIKEGQYNPFAEDGNIALRLAGSGSSGKKTKAVRRSVGIARNSSKTSNSFSGASRRAPGPAEAERSQEDSFKLKTANVLGELRHYDPKLSWLLKDENWEVRKSAVEAFAKIGRYDPQLMKLLKDDNFYVRKSAADALGKIRHYDPELASLLKDENPETRSRAANILGEIRRYIPELSSLFEEENAYVRWSAVDALGKMKRYDPKITAALKDENIGVRQRAAEALKEISGRKVIEDYGKLYGLEERVMELSVLKDVHQSIKPSGRNPSGKTV